MGIVIDQRAQEALEVALARHRPQRHEQDDRQVGQTTRERAKREQRRGIGPLQVLEREHDGPGSGRFLDQLDQGVDDTELNARITGQHGRPARSSWITGEQTRDLGSPRLLLIGDAADRSRDRTERTRALHLVGATDEHAVTPLSGKVESGLEDSRLADPCLALDEHGLQAAVSAALETCR
jgi:hypothetical protein